jgi:hypothetical protein
VARRLLITKRDALHSTTTAMPNLDNGVHFFGGIKPAEKWTLFFAALPGRDGFKTDDRSKS